MVNVLFVGAAATAVIACATDLGTRRIPNVLTMGSAAIALAARAWMDGTSAVGLGLAGLIVGFTMFLPLFMVRGLGGGDVKLLAALGAWLGPLLVMWTALFGAIAGGVAAIVVAVANRYVVQAYHNIWLLLTQWRVAGIGAVAGLTLDDAKSPRLAYALPLTGGLLVAIWLKG